MADTLTSEPEPPLQDMADMGGYGLMEDVAWARDELLEAQPLHPEREGDEAKTPKSPEDEARDLETVAIETSLKRRALADRRAFASSGAP